MLLHRNAPGYAAVTLLVGLPLVIMLFGGIAAASLWGLQRYAYIFADAELQQEMTYAMQRVQGDLRTARQVYLVRAGKKSRLEVAHADDQGKVQWQAYYLNNVTGVWKLVYSYDSHPLTGNHMLAGVTVETFECRKLGPNLYAVVLRGRSMVSGHSYTLRTLTYVRPGVKGG